MFGVDVSTCQRCDAERSLKRGFYHSASRHSAGQLIAAGWSYQWIAQLSFDADSWAAPLDAMGIPPRADATEETITQVKRLVEHTYRFVENALGWTALSLCTPEQADRWTWLIVCAYTQLRLARGLVDDLHLPWERPCDPPKLTPACAEGVSSTSCNT